jgi:alkyldihydroxyacetonephosphate synthase
VALLPRPAASSALVVDLARVVGARAVSTLEADRFAYTRDLWPRDLLRLRAGEIAAAPSCVVWPETPEQVARVLELAERLELPVVAWGAGSGVAGGARPSQGGIVLDLKRLRAIRRIDVDDLRVEVEAGILGERLERALDERGLTLGHFPSSIVCSTLGGWLAARSAGQMSTLYGKIEDMCLGLEVALPEGVVTAMHGPRPVRGPDVNALVIGSEGTLGVITAARLRVAPRPEQRLMRGLRFRDVESGLEGIRRMLRIGLRPAVVRLYDALDTFIGRGHGDEVEAEPGVRSFEAVVERSRGLYAELAAKLPAALRGRLGQRATSMLVGSTVRAVLGAPLVLNRALEVLPEEALLVLGFEGQPALVAREQEAALGVARALGAQDLGPGPGEHWLRNRYNMSFKASKAYATGAFVDTMEVAATWDRLVPLYRAVRQAIAREAFVMAHFSHAYPEGCSIYFTFAGAAEAGDVDDVLARYDRLWRGAIAAVHGAGGTLSHHHGVGELKADGMAREHGPGGMRVLSALKGAFDPAFVLNPGKLGLARPEIAERRRRGLPSPRARGELPREIRAAVGERNVMVSGNRTTVRPPDESALASLLRVASQRGIAVVSDQTGFRAPPGAVSIDLGRLAGVARISAQSLFVEVEAGVRVDALEDTLARQGLTLGLLHPRAEGRTVGAALARNLAVRRGVALGALGDLCFATRGLLASGEPLDTRPVPRSATGPELDRVLVGAEGRFGLITRATLRVALRPTHRAELGWRAPTRAAAIEAARLVLRARVRPLAARVLADGRFAVELAASSEDLLAAQTTLLETIWAGRGARVADATELARGGRFDAVVELGQAWSRAEATCAALVDQIGGDVWLDFLAPEGVTIVARVAEPAHRRAAAEIAAQHRGRIVAGVPLASLDERVDDAEPPDVFAGYARVLARFEAQLDPSGVFRDRRPA